MAEGNLLSLSWNNHLINWKSTLSLVIQKDTFSDVTIVCEGHFYSVHKIVLASCSEYFSAVLEKTPCRHPFIILKDISTKDIASLIAYMYRGEVSVSQSEVPSLIRAAETLGIKGLAASDDPPPPAQPSVTPEGAPRPRAKKRKSNPVADTQADSFNSKKIKNEDPVPQEALPQIDADDVRQLDDNKKPAEESTPLKEPLPTYPSSANDFPDIDVLEVKREGATFDDDAPVQLATSDKNETCDQLKSDYAMVDWLAFDRTISASEQDQEQLDDLYFDVQDGSDRQDHLPLMAPGHPCNLCPKLFQSRADVVRHMRTHTGEKPFKCPYCEYRAALKGNLKSHVISRHPDACV